MFCGFGEGEIGFGVYLLAYLYGLGISQVALGVKNMPANAGGVKDAGSIPGSGCLGRKPPQAPQLDENPDTHPFK